MFPRLHRKANGRTLSSVQTLVVSDFAARPSAAFAPAPGAPEADRDGQFAPVDGGKPAAADEDGHRQGSGMVER